VPDAISGIVTHSMTYVLQPQIVAYKVVSSKLAEGWSSSLRQSVAANDWEAGLCAGR